MGLAVADIDWARRAMQEGRSLDFIASVLEMPARKVGRVLGRLETRSISLATVEPDSAPAFYAAKRPYVSKLDGFRRADEEGVFLDRPTSPYQAAAMAEADAPPSRKRRNLLRRQFARHWDAIWFHRGRGMCGRTLRAIYGADALVWSVGGGIDVEF